MGIQLLYKLVLEMTVARVKEEKAKANKLSRRTLKMIALTQDLYAATIFRWFGLFRFSQNC